MAADRRYMIVDGELLAWQPREGAYIYQYIHTLDYKLRNAEPHIEILHALSQELFGQERILQELWVPLVQHLLPENVMKEKLLTCYP